VTSLVPAVLSGDMEDEDIEFLSSALSKKRGLAEREIYHAQGKLEELKSQGEKRAYK